MKQTVVCLGELLIDFVPETNGLALSDVASFRRAAGGAPANVAAAVSKLGGTSRFIGKVGADPFGDYLYDTLRESGVDVSTLLRTNEARTGLAFVSLRTDGERDFLFYRSPAADMLLTPEEISPGVMADAAVFHYGSVSLIADPCRSATDCAARLARDTGAIVSYDPNVRLSLWADEAVARETILARLGFADLVKVSEEEVGFLTGESHNLAAGAAKLLAAGPSVIVVTLGAEGCRVYTASSSRAVPGLHVDAVDTTGAGDGFMGGLLYELARRGVRASELADAFEDASFADEALGFANAVGAVTVTKRGAIPALPTLSAVAARIAEERKKYL